MLSDILDLKHVSRIFRHSNNPADIVFSFSIWALNRRWHTHKPVGEAVLVVAMSENSTDMLYIEYICMLCNLDVKFWRLHPISISEAEWWQRRGWGSWASCPPGTPSSWSATSRRSLPRRSRISGPSWKTQRGWSRQGRVRIVLFTLSDRKVAWISSVLATRDGTRASHGSN